jgi:hypothetical protein
MTEKSNQAVQQLHIDCVRTLRSYITEANETCKLLVGVQTFPVSVEQRIGIVEQRQRENIASDQYHVARRRLFDAANWD